MSVVYVYSVCTCVCFCVCGDHRQSLGVQLDHSSACSLETNSLTEPEAHSLSG